MFIYKIRSLNSNRAKYDYKMFPLKTVDALYFSPERGDYMHA